MADVRVSTEGRRGCGYRKGGGIYVVNDGPGRACGRFPVPLEVCPTCGAGVKPARGWTWVDGEALLERAPCSPAFWEPPCDSACSMSAGSLWKLHRAGLIWVGEKYYPDPETFQREAARMGISRRIKAIPRDFKVGETWILLAHRKAVPALHVRDCPADGARSLTGQCGPQCVGERPGIFSAFVPLRVEYVIKGTETPAELDALEERGLDLVEVRRKGTTLRLV